MKRKKTSAVDRPWTPFETASIPGLKLNPGQHVYVNSRYQVLMTEIHVGGARGWWLSIKARDKAPVHDWRDMQRIKNELVGEEVEAVELYPAESRLVDTSNQYHLWAFEGVRFPFGYMDRRVSNGPFPETGAVQRPFRDDERPADVKSERELWALDTRGVRVLGLEGPTQHEE